MPYQVVTESTYGRGPLSDMRNEQEFPGIKISPLINMKHEDGVGSILSFETPLLEYLKSARRTQYIILQSKFYIRIPSEDKKLQGGQVC